MRHAARAVVLDPAYRLLLVRFEFPPPAADSGVVWACPGGGLEPDETHERAVVRELAEEVGLGDVAIGPCIWTREHVIPIGRRWDGQTERFYLVRTETFEPAPRFTLDQLAAEYVAGMAWWTPLDLASADVRFAPRRLPELIASLLAEGPPGAPIDTGV